MIPWFLAACSGAPQVQPAPEPPPKPALPAPRPEHAPHVQLSVPTREGRTPAPLKSDPIVMKELARVRGVLEEVVRDHGRDPQNPWAVGHAMLALGADTRLENDADPVDWLFSEYGEVVTVGKTELVTFPAARGAIRVEPHSDLVLKVLTESGVSPDRTVTVDGRPFQIQELYRHSLWRAWIKGTATGFQEGSFNDTPWALQGLAAWAPPDLAWVASGGRDMTMSTFTSDVLDNLDYETREMSAAMDKGIVIQKDTRRGLFRYTCGGQHLVQGAAYAVARGFGPSDGKARMCRQLDILRWRIDVELNTLDPLIQSGERPTRVILLGQRMKFLGHYLETAHKIGALGLCELNADHVASLERVAVELARTVKALEDLGVFVDLDAIKADSSLELRPGGAEQVYLDFIGDSAHAVRGIDLALGKGTIRY